MALLKTSIGIGSAQKILTFKINLIVLVNTKINPKIKILVLVILQVTSAILPLILGSEQTKNYAPIILFVYTLLGAKFFWLRKSLLIFLSPNSLVFFYTSLSLLFGSIAFSTEAVLVSKNIIDYSLHLHTDIALSFIMIGMICFPLFEVLKGDQVEVSNMQNRVSFTHVLVVAIIALPFIIADFDFSIVGGSGSLAPYLISLSAAAIVLWATKFKATFRYSIYLLVFLLMVGVSSHDKRIAIFLIFVLAFFEARSGALKLNIRGVLISVVGGGVTILAILAMSINRGYGDFVQDVSIIEASGYVMKYINSDIFMAAFFQNIEVSYFYFHYLNAIELIFSGREPLALGSTMIKPLFLFFPRDIIGWKPDSIITLYTIAHDPGFRSIGGSWPTNFAAEYFWNFHIFGLLIFPIFAKINVIFYRKLLSDGGKFRPYIYIFMIAVYMQIVTYARGSGLDQLTLSLIIFGVFCMLSSVVYLAIRRAL